MALLALVSISCRGTGSQPPDDPSLHSEACATVLQRSIDDARDRDADRVYVDSSDEVCATAIEKAIASPGVEPRPSRVRRRCPGRSCGPRDGNPLVMIHHERDDCFRVTTLRWTGGTGSTRCLDPHDAPMGAVVY